MNTDTGFQGTFGWFGRASTVLAVIVVQAIAFWTAYTIGRPTWYVPFMLASAALLAYASGEGWFGMAAATFGAILLIAVGLPLALFVARQDPDVIAEMAGQQSVHRMLYLSVYGPLLAAFVSVIFGVPLAYLLARGFRGQALIETLVDLPLVVPHSVAGIIILFSFGQGGLFPWVGILGQMTGMVIAMTFVSAPFAVNTAREAFETIDPRLGYAARSQGATQFETFRRVTAPLATRGILTGGVLAWARSVSEFGAVAIVAYNVEFSYPVPLFGETTFSNHAPVFIFKTYNAGSIEQSGAVSIILLALSAAIFVLVRWLAYDNESTGGVL